MASKGSVSGRLMGSLTQLGYGDGHGSVEVDNNFKQRADSCMNQIALFEHSTANTSGCLLLIYQSY